MLHEKISAQWPEIFDFLNKLKPIVHYKKVVWQPPPKGILKCNTDGAIRGSPGKSSYRFCIRDNRADVMFAQSTIIPDTINNEAEAVAIREAMAFYVAKGYEKCIVEIDSLLIQNNYRKEVENSIMKWADISIRVL